MFDSTSLSFPTSVLLRELAVVDDVIGLLLFYLSRLKDSPRSSRLIFPMHGPFPGRHRRTSEGGEAWICQLRFLSDVIEELTTMTLNRTTQHHFDCYVRINL